MEVLHMEAFLSIRMKSIKINQQLCLGFFSFLSSHISHTHFVICLGYVSSNLFRFFFSFLSSHISRTHFVMCLGYVSSNLFR
jgi:hypothetical protein